MKISRCLMLAYIVCLIIIALLSPVINEACVMKFSVAATVAGVLFAYADLRKYAANQLTDHIDVLLPCYQKHSESIQKELMLVDQLLDYVRCPDRLDTISKRKLRAYPKEMRWIIESRIALVRLQKQIDKPLHMCENYEAESKKETVAATIFFTLGFLIFFVLICFDTINELLNRYQSVCTLLAFALLMSNYLVRELCEEWFNPENQLFKKKIEELQVTIEKTEQQIDMVCKANGYNGVQAIISHLDDNK